MKILALECSAGPVSAAIIENGSIINSDFSNVKLTHSQTLMPMVENILSGASLTFNDIDGLAISNGPGSFTGIRIGISALKGLGAPKKLPCVAVSTLEAIAHNYINTNAIVCAVMDARCNQVYNAVFRTHNGSVERLCEDRAILCQELAEDLKLLSQNKKNCVIIAGDGTEVFWPFVQNMTGFVKSSEAQRYQNAVSVGLTAEKQFLKGNTLTPNELLPVYLRLPQAERELKKKQETENNL